MTALNELKIFIDCENSQWQYKLEKSDIRLESYQRFRKRAKNAIVYALVDVNHLIPLDISSLVDKLPNSLRKNYPNVFLA